MIRFTSSVIRFPEEPSAWRHLPGEVLCPDRLTLDMLGAADNNRGRLVRGFIRLLDRLWPVR